MPVAAIAAPNTGLAGIVIDPKLISAKMRTVPAKPIASPAMIFWRQRQRNWPYALGMVTNFLAEGLGLL